jgi:hypothetical protein
MPRECTIKWNNATYDAEWEEEEVKTRTRYSDGYPYTDIESFEITVLAINDIPFSAFNPTAQAVIMQATRDEARIRIWEDHENDHFDNYKEASDA